MSQPLTTEQLQQRLEGELKAQLMDESADKVLTAKPNVRAGNPITKGALILEVIQSFMRANGLLPEEVVVSAAKFAWDNWVVPYDIPFLTDAQEERFEAFAWDMVEKAIREFVD